MSCDMLSLTCASKLFLKGIVSMALVFESRLVLVVILFEKILVDLL